MNDPSNTSTTGNTCRCSEREGCSPSVIGDIREVDKFISCSQHFGTFFLAIPFLRDLKRHLNHAYSKLAYCKTSTFHCLENMPVGFVTGALAHDATSSNVYLGYFTAWLLLLQVSQWGWFLHIMACLCACCKVFQPVCMFWAASRMVLFPTVCLNADCSL